MEINSSLISSRISHLFKNLSQEDIDEILEQSEFIHLEPGGYLIRQGDDSTTLYFLITGRLRSIYKEGQTAKVLGDVGAGEPVGELAFFSGNPRSASVLAVRKSRALALSKSGFQKIVSKRPPFARRVNQFIINRLNRNSLEVHKQVPPKNIAVIKLDPNADFSAWSDKMLAYFEHQSLELNIYDQSESPQEGTEDFFESLDNNEGLNLLVVDQNDLDWSHKCLIYSDLVVVATAFTDNPKLTSIEKSLDIYQEGILGKKVYLLMLHEKTSDLPENTAKWLKKRQVNLAIHLRKNHDSDIGRFCRILTHKANGLVLGGGGAKGYAHIGVVKAMQKKGIPIDFIGGTSAGALYGLAMAFCDFDIDKVQEISEDSVKKKITSNDLDVPLISIMSGKKLTRFIKALFGNRHVEDIWVNSFCVSTNFTKAELTVHERGEIWRRVRASISIPGIFPPVVIDNYLHVDGAVMDNLPIEPMYRFPVDNIYAVSLSGMQDIKTNYDDVPTSKQLLSSRISGKRKYKIPSISSIIINSLTLSSRQRQELTKTKVSHYLELDLKGVSFLDNKKWKGTVEKGYEQTIEWLKGIEEASQVSNT